MSLVEWIGYAFAAVWIGWITASVMKSNSESWKVVGAIYGLRSTVSEIRGMVETVSEAMFGKPDNYVPPTTEGVADDSGVPIAIENCKCGHRQDWHTTAENADPREGIFQGSCRMQNCSCQKYRSIKSVHTEDSDVLPEGHEIH